MRVNVEDQLRAAGRAVTDQVRDLPRLTLPQTTAPVRHWRAGVPHRLPRWRAWLVPVAAAAAVAALAIALVSIRSARDDGGIPRPVSVPPVSGPAVPRYYVDLNPVPSGAGLKAIVGDSRTGAVLATFNPPAGYSFGGVTAAADDKTFVVGVERYGADYAHSWYLLRVSPGSARPATLAKLPIDAPLKHAGVNGLALSPDGRTLAILSVANVNGVPQGTKPGPYTLRTYSLATGRALRGWTVPAPSMPGAGITPDNTKELTWTADGHTLSFLDVRAAPSATVPQNLRTLDVRSAGRDLIADSRVIPMRGDPGRCFTLRLAADGRTMTCGTFVMPTRACRTLAPEFDAYSALTGKLTRVLYRYQGPCAYGVARVLWTGTGSTAIGIIQAQLTISPPIKTRLLPGLLTGHGFTPLRIKLAGVPLAPGEIAFLPADRSRRPGRGSRAD